MWLRGDEQCSMHSHMWRNKGITNVTLISSSSPLQFLLFSSFVPLFQFTSFDSFHYHWSQKALAALSIPLAINWSSPSSWPIPLIPLLNDSLQQIVVCLKRTEDLLSEITRPMPEEYSTQVRAWEERWLTRWLKKRVWPSSCLDSTISQFPASAVWYPSSIFLLYTWDLFPVDGESHQSSKSYLLMDGRTVWRGSLRHIRMRISKVRHMRTRVAASMLPSQSLPWEPNWRY